MNDVFDKYWGALVIDAYKRVLNYSLAEDCAQETMINYFMEIKNGAVFKSDKQIAKYLFITNSHNASKLKYKMSVWQKGTLEIPIRYDTGDFSTPLIKREQSEQLNEALLNLPEHYIKPVISHYAYGLSFEDIARSIGTSSDSVRRYAGRGLKKLKCELEDENND